MEQINKSLSLFEFQERFSSDNQCLVYLAAEKWKNGYSCPKCGHTHYCAGHSLYSQQVTATLDPSCELNKEQWTAESL